LAIAITLQFAIMVPSFLKNLIAIFPCGGMAMYKNGHEKSRRIFVH